MFPISASMLKNSADYDASLEAFSWQLMPLVGYSLDNDGRMTVYNETAIRRLRLINIVEHEGAL
jgi:hypothetical protein